MADLIIALDAPDRDRALALVDRLGSGADHYKVGLELFSRWGPEAVTTLRERGKRIFLDLKLHDIPNTVAGAVRSAAALGAGLLTVHAAGGSRMIQAAVEAARESGPRGPRILAVTLLTSMDPHEVAGVWGRQVESTGPEVVRLARMARQAGVDGVVASALEARALRGALGPDALVVTPGIRLPGGTRHDQRRVSTPQAAIRAGADHLVVGRAVTADPDPAAALVRVRQAMEAT